MSTEMTAEELERLKQYNDKIKVAGGITEALTEDETMDLRMLIKTWMDENEIKYEKKEVTKGKYARVLEQHQDEVYHIAIKAWQMPILHRLIALAADHPRVKKFGWPTTRFIRQTRWWCREKFRDWGFTEEEVEYLDKIREDAQGNITEE